MTTYQDQPLSRRAIREREAEAARAASTPEGTQDGAAAENGSPDATSSSGPAPAGTPEPLTYVTQGRAPLPQYDAPVASEPTTSQPVVSEPTADAPSEDAGDAGFRYRDYSPDGRRAARLGWPQAPTESADLDYRTQGRADVPLPTQAPAASGQPVAAPSEAALSRRELRALREQQEREAGIAPARDEPQAASAGPAFDPQASATPVEASAPVAAPEWLAAFAPPTALGDAQAQAAEAHAEAHEAQPHPEPSAFDDILIGETVDDVDDVDDTPGPVVVAEQVRDVPPPLIEPAEPSTDALASFEALFRSEPAASSPSTVPPASAPQSPIFPTPLVSAPPAVANPVTAPPAAEEPRAEAPQAEAPPMPTFAQYSNALQPPSPLRQTAAPEAVPSAPAATPPSLAFIPAAPASEAPQAPAGPEVAAPEAPASDSQPPVAGERPRNHWSRQAELDDEAPETGAIARSVGSAPTTASALVLPEIPAPDFMASPLTSTGDVVVTGSISLPASLSSTGALPTQLDESDLDHMLDPGDHQVASTDSQPVRAIRAVSTHTSSREIIGTIKPKRSNRALTALIISAAGMAVVVVALLVVAVASGVLGS